MTPASYTVHVFSEQKAQQIKVKAGDRIQKQYQALKKELHVALGPAWIEYLVYFKISIATRVICINVRTKHDIARPSV